MPSSAGRRCRCVLALGRTGARRAVAVRRPRLCFFGCLGWWIDLEIIKNFATSCPDWSIIIVGPVRADVTVLERLPNITFLGTKPHHALSAYLRPVDVIGLPYALSEFTRGVMPAKRFEALATGKPVVATPIPELLPFGGVVDLADRTDFTGAVLSAFEADGPWAAAKRVAVARENSWEARIASIESTIQQAMAVAA